LSSKPPPYAGTAYVLLHSIGHPRPIALGHKLKAHSGHSAPLLRKGRKRESIHAGLEFIWEMSADIS
jgi:hypothetical protein